MKHFSRVIASDFCEAIPNHSRRLLRRFAPRNDMFLIASLILLALLNVACVASPNSPSYTPSKYDPGVDPSAWATIPAGDFYFGQHEELTKVDYAFEMMVALVTNKQYADFLNKAIAEGKIKIADNKVMTPYVGDKFIGRRHEKKILAGDYPMLTISNKDLRVTYDSKLFAAKSPYENHPVVGVTWFGAKAFCEYYGGQLPTETEWEKAARGTDKRAYPWGDEIAAGNANFYASQDPYEKMLGQQGDTTPVGFYNGKVYDGFQTVKSMSPYGLYDMAGNVWQWTNNLTEGMHYRYMRGGSHGTYEYNLRVWSRNAAEPDFASPSIGFRCIRKK